MPARMPVSARGPPLALTMMRARPGAMLRWMPSTSKLKLSILPPEKTVLPWPFMPGRISRTAMVAGGSAPARTRQKPKDRAVLKSMGMRDSTKEKPSRGGGQRGWVLKVYYSNALRGDWVSWFSKKKNAQLSRGRGPFSSSVRVVPCEFYSLATL